MRFVSCPIQNFLINLYVHSSHSIRRSKRQRNSPLAVKCLECLEFVWLSQSAKIERFERMRRNAKQTQRMKTFIHCFSFAACASRTYLRRINLLNFFLDDDAPAISLASFIISARCVVHHRRSQTIFVVVVFSVSVSILDVKKKESNQNEKKATRKKKQP